MTKKTNNYNFQYFTRGSDYSADADFKRFVCLDYNLESYIGIIGVGIISGWDIVPVEGEPLSIQILPGKGIIDGYAVESPYYYKLRSEMINGDREIEEINDSSAIYNYLTPEEYDTYVSVIKLYDPLYIPEKVIENRYVKIVVPLESKLVIPSNSERFIFVERDSNSLPYPKASDYPSNSMVEPSINNYANYNDYKAAVDTYNNYLSQIHNYKWRANQQNHYSAVSFKMHSSKTASKDSIFIGRVLTSNDTIVKVDISKIDSLKSLEASIKKIAAGLLKNHVHGGSSYFDPPKIKLKTDVRKCILSQYNANTKVSVFNVLSPDMTSLSLGHKHYFYLDENNNGSTAGIMGSGIISHYHNISGKVVSSPVLSSQTIDDHIHTIPDIDMVGGWLTTTPFDVFVNGVYFGNQDSSSVIADPLNNTLELFTAVGAAYKTYSSSFLVNGDTYSYSESCHSIYQFMLKMMSNYIGIYGFDGNPFTFEGEVAGSIAGFDDLKKQCIIAESLLLKNGDSFLFTPNAANNIAVTLENVGYQGKASYDVNIEILGNTEVTGILKPENVTYIAAEKIAMGKFDIARIPFISHIGRMNEIILPIQYPLISNDGIRYFVSPSITSVNTNHYHGLYLNKKETGITNKTFVDGQQSYYKSGTNGEIYLVDHTHGVINGNILENNTSSSISNGLVLWQNYLNGSNVSSVTHSHKIIEPSKGNVKIIYSIKESKNGTLFAGTSDGLNVIPNGDSYLYIINGEEFHLIGNDLWDLLLEASVLYQQKTETSIVITWDVYGTQIQKAYDMLINHGDSYLLYGANNPSSGQDIVMLKKLDYFLMPNFYSVNNRAPYDVKGNETIIGFNYIDNLTGKEISENQAKQESANTSSDISTVAITETPLNETPIWSIELYKTANSASNTETIVVSGSDVVAQNEDAENNLYSTWTSPTIPSYAGSIKKSISDSQKNIWSISSGGVLIIRYYLKGNSFETITQPGTSPNINDIIEGSIGKILVACPGGIYKTIDSGLSWNKVFKSSSECIQIIRDYLSDKTNTVSGHYHKFNVNMDGDGILSQSIGSGVSHTHIVNEWNVAETIGHSHSLVTKLYFYTTNGEIYVSEDSGDNWIVFGKMPHGENCSLFAFNEIYTGKKDGIYKYSNGAWDKIKEVYQYVSEELQKIVSEPIFCFSMKYNMNGFFVGSQNRIYETEKGESFTELVNMDGQPSPILYNENGAYNYGYSYNAKNNSFHFKEITYSDSQTFSLVDFQKWYVKNGSWKTSSNYDIYINKKLIFSSKYNIDKRIESGYGFTVSPSDGIIDFSISTTLNSKISLYDNSFTVVDASKFYTGDKICIFWTGTFDETKLKDVIENSDMKAITEQLGGSKYVNIDQKYINLYLSEKDKYKNMIMFTEISSIDGNTIYVTENFDRDIETPAAVYRIPNLDGSTEMSINIYDSPFGDIGSFSHDEIENKLSNYSDGRPYNFNNVFLGNLLQLTQAIKYAKPNVDENYINSKFYDFNYSWSETDLGKPYVGDYIDLFDSEIYNFSLFSETFFKKGANRVNKIVNGTGDFYGFVFVATDIGIFWAKKDDLIESNWFLSPNLSDNIYDIIIFGNQIIACTSNGTYITNDMKTWNLQQDQSIYFPSQVTGYRWSGGETIFIDKHDAEIKNGYDGDSNVGSITTNGLVDLYSSIGPNRKIEIKSDQEPLINGVYTTKEIINGNIFTTYENFPEEVSVSDLTIRMGAWWEYLTGEQSTNNPNITNTVFVGGKDKIAYCSNVNGCVWSQAFIPNELLNFQVSSFCPLSNGTVFASTIGTQVTSPKNNIIKSSGSGGLWKLFKSLESVNGSILNSTRTDFNHIKLNVSYSPSRIYETGDLAKKEILIFNSLSEISYSSTVLWNEFDEKNENDCIYVYGGDFSSISNNELNNLSFTVLPLKINSIMEDKTKNVLYGTDNGIYTDEKSTMSLNRYTGQILDVGTGGIVSKVDMGCTIKAASKISQTNKTEFIIYSSENIAKNSLVGRNLYVTDLSKVETHLITYNSGNSSNGEIVIDVDSDYNKKFDLYDGKKIVISSQNGSRIYVSFNTKVMTDQFLNGKLYVASNENLNLGQTYNIIGNTEKYVDVLERIIPSSTFINGTISKDVSFGQTVRLAYASGTIDLFVKYDNPVNDNQLGKMNLRVSSDSGSAASQITNIIVNSNDRNSIVVNPFVSINSIPAILSFNIGDKFSVYGNVFTTLKKFDNKITSIEEDHYHRVQTVNGKISGKINTLEDVNSSLIKLNVIETKNFDNSIVQNSSDLLKGAKITLYNEQDGNRYWYETRVESHDSSSITVETKDDSIWRLLNYDKNFISSGWMFEIIAYNYGYTNGTYFKDLTVINSKVKNDIDINTNMITVNSTVGIVEGDKIIIYDDRLISEINYVKHVLDSNTLELQNITGQYYFVKNNAYIKVLRDVFENNHTHQIRENQVEPIFVQSFLDLGYNSFHYHKIQPWIKYVRKIVQKDNKIIAVGSSENIIFSYNSEVNGDWNVLADLRTSTGKEISGVNDIMIDNNNNFVLGTENGFILTERDKNIEDLIIPLEKPLV